ncbi:TolC family protein [bacterium]|nr:TolC family protein [bacterium]
MIFILILSFTVVCTTLFAQDFTNLSLKEAFQIALRENKNILSHRENINIKKGEFWSEISLPNPEISWEFEDIPKDKALSGYEKKRIAVTQEIEFPTNYFFKAKALNSEIIQTEIEVRAEENELKNEVMKTYFEVVLAKEMIKLAKANFEQTKQFYENVKKQNKFGETDKLSVLKANVKKSIAKNELETIQNDSVFIANKFLNLLGFDAEKVNSLTLLDSLSVGNNSLPKMTNGFLANPILQLTKNQKEFAKTNQRLVYSEILPNFSFSYFQDKPKNLEKSWGIELGISVPIWIMNYRGNIQKANAKLRQAKLNESFVDFSLKNKFLEIELNLQKAQNQIELFKNEILIEAKEAFEISEKNYKEGEIGFLDFFDSQQLLIEVQKEYLISQFNFQIAKADFLTLTGFQQY